MPMDFRKNKIISYGVLIILIIIFFVYINIDDSAEKPVTKTKVALDTVCSITVYGNTADEVFDECFDKIQEIEKKMSVHRTESDISAINKNAGIKPVRVSEDTYNVIRTGKKYGEITEGRFDITVGPLVNLWGINTPDNKIPSEENLKSTMPLVNYQNIILNEKEKSVYLTEKGMALDLGGIAKGYSGDAVAGILKKHQVKHAIVDLGGNLLVIGSKPDGTDWNVGIQTPFQPNGEYLGILNVSDQAVVTSGIYQRYFEKDGKIYHHIMDTATGYPINNGLVSVTVVYKSSMDADALAKAFTLGLKNGMKFIEGQKGAEAIFVTDKSEVYLTPGLKDSFEITNKEYKLME